MGWPVCLPVVVAPCPPGRGARPGARRGLAGDRARPSGAGSWRSLGRRLTAQNLARRDDDRKYPILLTLAAQSAVDVLDEVLLLFDQALSGREAAARERLTEVLAERARTGEDRQALLDDILAIVLDPGVTDGQVGGRLRRDVGH